jgi:hypothetical protein
LGESLILRRCLPEKSSVGPLDLKLHPAPAAGIPEISAGVTDIYFSSAHRSIRITYLSKIGQFFAASRGMKIFPLEMNWTDKVCGIKL